MYCPFCGSSLHSLRAFCSSCGKDIKFLLHVDEPGTSEEESTAAAEKRAVKAYQKFRSLKEARRSCLIKKKAQQTGNVKISVALMELKHGELKPVRGTVLPLAVKPEMDAKQLHKVAGQKIKDFNQNCEIDPYFLLYPDGAEIINIPGTETPFTVKSYKEAVRKAYQRITVYICTAGDFLGSSQEPNSGSDKCDSNSERVITSRSAAEFNSPDTVTGEQCKVLSPTVERGAGGTEKGQPEEDLSAQEGVSRSPARDVEMKPETGMCSVVGCDSHRRNVQRLKLPEDPEKRLQWVQFVLEVNGQQLKESSWTDVAICSEHFTSDCFINTNPVASTVQLRGGAVPSLCIKSEADEPEKSPEHVEPAETPCDDFKIENTASCSGTSQDTPADVAPSGLVQMQEKEPTTEVNQKMDVEMKPETGMCSVVGCDSHRRNVQRLKLPEDPEKRLQWVQFVLEVNGQQLKESSWTDVAICSEHFTSDCFINTNPVASTVQLRGGAVPSLCIKSEADEPEKSPEHVEPAETPCDDFKIENTASCSGTSQDTPADVAPSGLVQMQEKEPTTEVNQKMDVEMKPETGMCSVVGCDSHRRNVQRLKLPEDPEKRLQWVQFVLEVNGQQLKESSWTDVAICSEHFTSDCFINTNPVASTVQLRGGAVPSLCIKSEADEPEKSPEHVEPAETPTIDETPCDDFKTESTFSCSGTSQDTSPDVSEAAPSRLVLTPRKGPTAEVNRYIGALLQMKGKFVVNEKCLFQLVGRRCPSCGSKLQIDKVTCEAFLVLNRHCLKCNYSNQWKNLADANIPTADQRPTEETSENQQAESPACNSAVVSEIVVFSNEESDDSQDVEDADEDGVSSDGVSSDGVSSDGVSSDGEWNPVEDILLAEEPTMDSDEDSGDGVECLDSRGGLVRELCAECGAFFDRRKHHTCVHKEKPFSCNICGKRCMTEMSLQSHARIHKENYEHRCKYCCVTFKTRVDKLKHEDSHQNTKDPYMCPDCPQTFATHKQRNIHLVTHRGPNEHKCGVCGTIFKSAFTLLRHSLVHTGVKPHKCSVCDRSFTQPSHLKSHMRLHTGERPYKCRRCDKSFNHNVSLKSHVQRCHASSSGGRLRRLESSNDGHDAKDEDNTDPDVEFDSVEEERDLEEEEQKAKAKKPPRSRSSGRPRGRPKKTAEEMEADLSNTGKSKRRRTKKFTSNDEESEEVLSEDNMSFESAEEDEDQEVQKHRIPPKRTRHDSDSDFNPEEETKQRKCRSQRGGRSSGKPRGKPGKSVTV